MNAPMSRTPVLSNLCAGLGTSSVAGLGFSPSSHWRRSEPSSFAQTTETRSTCPYCSVSCGVIMYTPRQQGEKHQDAASSISKAIPIIRSIAARCARRAPALLDMVHSPNACSTRRYASRARNEWKRISWDDALTRVAKHMKADRDANFVETNDKGVTVNRWNTTGISDLERDPERAGLPCSENGTRAGDGRARYPSEDLTRANGVQSGPDIWQRCDDQPLGGHQEH